MKEDETKTEQSTSATPATSVGHTHTPVSGSHEQSHDTMVIPGLPPLPLLPTPPTHCSPTHYPSALAGSEGGLYSTNGGQATGKSAASLSQPCEKPLSSQKIVKPSLPVITTHRKPKIDAVLFNPTGLSKSERVSEYLATADTKTASGEGTAVTPGLVGGKAAHLRVAPHSQVTGPTSRTTGPVTLHRQTGPTSRTTGPVTLHRQTGYTSRTTGPVTLHRQTGSTSRLSGPVSTVGSARHRQTGPAVDSTLHRVTSNSNGAAEMAKSLHRSSTPLIAVVSGLLGLVVCALGSAMFFT